MSSLRRCKNPIIFTIFLSGALLFSVQVIQASDLLPIIEINRKQNQQKMSYGQYIRIARDAQSRRDFDTALINYGRALRAAPENEFDILASVNDLLEARLSYLQTTYPRYVQLIRSADEAYNSGDYDTAISNYQRALQERPRDYYATRRIRQAECILTEKPATGSQFNLFCPSIFPDE